MIRATSTKYLWSPVFCFGKCGMGTNITSCESRMLWFTNTHMFIIQARILAIDHRCTVSSTP